MIAKILLLLLILLTVYHKTNQTTLECQIFSNTHKRYIYGLFKIPGIGAWRRIGLSGEIRREYEFSNKDIKGVWSLEPVSGRKSTFLIASKIYRGEYLRVLDTRSDLLNTPGIIFAQNLNHRLQDELFMWRIEPVDQQSNVYTIFNVKLNLPMVVKETLAEHTNRNATRYITNVVISKQNTAETELFQWFIKCKDNKKPQAEYKKIKSLVSI